MEPLTEKQAKVLAYIEERLAQGRPPSQRETARHFGLAQNAVFQLVRYLKNKGYLVDTGGHRGLRLSGEYRAAGHERTGLAIVGRVAAGEPILAQENIEAYMDLDTLFAKSKGSFLLRVRGDSMVDEGIMDGDLVVVEPSSTLANGRIGVVLLDDEATVKRVYFQKNRIALKAANRRAGYGTRYIRQFDKDTRVIGKVVGCIRTDVR